MSFPPRDPALLNFASAYEDGDAFYAALVDAIDSVGDEAAPQFLARLTLILSNQIGRKDVLLAAIAAAKVDSSSG
ncbi:MAG: DUF2783 domain-containing protein [Parvularculaceae bacterium]